MEIKGLKYDSRNFRYYLKTNLSVANTAYKFTGSMKHTVLLSGIASGNAKMQYTLDTDKNISNNTAIWHDWSVGDVSGADGGGLVFDGPVSAVRPIGSTANTVATIEILGGN